MPNRIIRESICTSETLAQITPQAERLWWRIIVQADDFGRMDARTQVIIGQCLTAFLPSVSAKDAEKWLQELAKVGLISLYRVDDKRYLQITRWDKYQSRRAKHSKYPDPQEGVSDCMQMHADASKCLFGVTNEESRNRGIEESRNRGTAIDFDKEFEIWWSGYPLKKGKVEARKHWEKLRKSGKTVEELTTYRDRYAAEIKAKRTEAKYILHGSTFLNGRWKDYEKGVPEDATGRKSGEPTEADYTTNLRGLKPATLD